MHRGQLGVALLTAVFLASQLGCSDPECPEGTRKIGVSCVPLRAPGDGGAGLGVVADGGSGAGVDASAPHGGEADGSTANPDRGADTGSAPQTAVGGNDAAIPSACNGPTNECGGCTAIESSHAKGQPCSNGGQGACDLPGTYGCLAGTTVCSAPSATASHEICDKKDNDCDGVIDNGFVTGAACTAGQGECLATGILDCNTAGAVACTAVAKNVSAPEVCDGKDNNCDGRVDDGLTACIDGKADVCTPNPCQNGGSCSNTGTLCTCPPGISGSHCETNVNDCPADACLPGTCRDGSNAYTCDCGSALFTVGQTCSRFRNNGDFTISDAMTGLTWQENVDANTFTWVEATNYCAGLSGATWRLPTLEELKGLVDSRRDPAIDDTYFKGGQAPSSSLASIFWSTTAVLGKVGPLNGVYYGFTYWSPTSSGATDATTRVSVRCVH